MNIELKEKIVASYKMYFPDQEFNYKKHFITYIENTNYRFVVKFYKQQFFAKEAFF